MRELVEYQRRFAATLLGLPGLDPELAAHPAIEIHRRTVLAGLLNALALSFPTIRRLTGAEYFEQLVHEFARRHPPQSAVLYDYGAELPGFLETFAGAEGFPYFRDVARFDWAVDQTAHQVRDRLRAAQLIPGYGRVRLPTSLTCVRFDYAVDLIRDAVESEEPGALSALDVGLNPRWLVLWRSTGGTSIKALSATAWQILTDLAAAYDGAAALERAMEYADAEQALAALASEILPSSFIHLNDQGP
jgi:hypothetical protein